MPKHVKPVPEGHRTVTPYLAIKNAARALEFYQKAFGAMNARHARDHADCTRDETVALHRKGAAVAAATIRALGDEELAHRGTLVPGAPPMSAEQLIIRGLLNHIDEHFGSIRKTVGHGKEPR
ncbi:MAG TPA: hypothetical protein VGD07_06410 [Methylomirabilota bacterium]|jgi:RNA-splicing ligase RtcB